MAKNENKNAEPQTVDLNQQRKVRREKLANPVSYTHLTLPTT